MLENFSIDGHASRNASAYFASNFDHRPTLNLKVKFVTHSARHEHKKALTTTTTLAMFIKSVDLRGVLPTTYRPT